MHDDDPFGFDSLDLGWLRAKQGVKWHRSRGELLAAWVADMDFPAPTVVTDALRAYVDRADLGYADFRNGTGLAELFAGRMAARHGWAPDPSQPKPARRGSATASLAAALSSPRP